MVSYEKKERKRKTNEHEEENVLMYMIHSYVQLMPTPCHFIKLLKKFKFSMTLATLRCDIDY